MTQWADTCSRFQPEFGPGVPCGGRREVTLVSHPLTSTHASWYPSPHTQLREADGYQKPQESPSASSHGHSLHAGWVSHGLPHTMPSPVFVELPGAGVWIMLHNMPSPEQSLSYLWILCTLLSSTHTRTRPSPDSIHISTLAAQHSCFNASALR